jgi:hypothetical protein
VQKDPFLIFLSDLSKKIALEKEHKQIMEKIYKYKIKRSFVVDDWSVPVNYSYN